MKHDQTVPDDYHRNVNYVQEGGEMNVEYMFTAMQHDLLEQIKALQRENEELRANQIKGWCAGCKCEADRAARAWVRTGKWEARG